MFLQTILKQEFTFFKPRMEVISLSMCFRYAAKGGKVRKESDTFSEDMSQRARHSGKHYPLNYLQIIVDYAIKYIASNL
jgi:hypothetical protein